MSPRDAAISLIRPYVERGDSLISLQSSHMGHAGKDYWASISGYLISGDRKTYHGTDTILVHAVNGQRTQEIFSLREIYNEVAQVAFQLSLFP